jgi:hypothetical protein
MDLGKNHGGKSRFDHWKIGISLSEKVFFILSNGSGNMWELIAMAVEWQ